MTRRQNRVFAVMKLPPRVPDLLHAARAIANASAANPLLTNAGPAIAALRGALGVLERAETAMSTRRSDDAAARDVALTAVRAALHELLACVQKEADADLEHAEQIVTSSGFVVRKPKARTKPPFSVKPGPTSGSALCEARAAAKRASYEWEASTDGGETWVRGGSSLEARFLFTGLPVAAIVLFRYRAVTRIGVGDWSEPISVTIR
jgi:hypothetical protein